MEDSKQKSYSLNKTLKLTGVVLLGLAIGLWIYKLTEFNKPFFDEYRLVKGGKRAMGKVIDCWVSVSSDENDTYATYFCDYSFIDSEGNEVTNYIEGADSFSFAEGDSIRVKYLENNSDVNLAESLICDDAKSSCMLGSFLLWLLRVIASLFVVYLVINLGWTSVNRVDPYR